MSPSKEISHLLPKRKKESHKGNYGRLFILAGSAGMSGACVLASKAAIRSGAGLVTVGVPKSLLLPLSKQLTEAMMKLLPETSSGTLSKKAVSAILTFLKTQTVLAIGPGLSSNQETKAVIQRVIISSTKPMVIDADALNAFSGKQNLLKKIKADAILTPHPGEFKRLFGGRVPKTESERKLVAKAVAKKFKITIVLKGSRTIVASKRGELFINSTGNPGMATGGSGDVLTGVIAALLGQGLAPFDAARTGVYIHGLAGDLGAKILGEISLSAGDLIGYLPKAFLKVVRS